MSLMQNYVSNYSHKNTIMKTIELIKKDSKGFVRVVILSLHDHGYFYVITRTTGLKNGKRTAQPDTVIERGKANRTIEEQANLEFKAIHSKYLDKGYKDLTAMDLHLCELSAEHLCDILSDVTTDTKGAIKPMLAQKWLTKKEQLKELPATFVEPMFSSYKLDGVRCCIYRDKNGNIVSSSRGGKSYDAIIPHILDYFRDKTNVFEDDTINIVLDGELYIHGESLQYISGLCRQKDYTFEHLQIKFNIFDCLFLDDLDTPFIHRKDALEHIMSQQENNDSIFSVLEHRCINTSRELSEHLEEALSAGYEGLICRKPSGVYKIGGRGPEMKKVKIFDEEEFKIIGIEQRKRDEDFVFKLETKEGAHFFAKPATTREKRAVLVNNASSLLGKQATIRFFGYTPYGIPNLPVLAAIRDYEF